MNAIYEYIFAGFIMFVMLVSLQTNLQTLMSDTTALTMQEEYNMSEGLIDMILLSPGNPPNWSSTNPVLFGLAAQETTDTYILDSKKVIRLDENYNDSLYLSPGELKSLLGLTSDINLIIRISPIFPIDIQPQEKGKFKIIVTNHKGVNLANVNITGYYVPESLGNSIRFQEQNITDIDGSCTLNFNVGQNVTSGYILVVCADLVGIKTMQTDPPYLRVRVEGGQVIQSDVPLITNINYTSGSLFGLNTDSAARYVEIDGFTYYFELEVWR
jgi:hypothetical protein